MDIAVIVWLVAATSWFVAFSLVVLNVTRGGQAQSTRGFGITIIKLAPNILPQLPAPQPTATGTPPPP